MEERYIKVGRSNSENAASSFFNGKWFIKEEVA